MTDDRLTPEERAVIEAAVMNLGQYVGTDLRDAVAAYCKATAPPEPFEGFIHRWGSTWDDAIYDRQPEPDASGSGQLWRCTITPTERVR